MLHSGYSLTFNPIPWKYCHITVGRHFLLCNDTAVHGGTTECVRITSTGSSSIVAGPGAGPSPDAPEIADRLSIISLKTHVHAFIHTHT